MNASIDFLGAPHESEVYSTLVIVRDISDMQDPSLLMGRKTRGFGKGKMVFPGGKVREYFGLTGVAIKPIPLEASRELQEETHARVANLENCARIAVNTDSDEDRSVYVMYGECADKDNVSLRPSSEFSHLAWVSQRSLDYSDMPKDYELWLPGVLAGRFVTAIINLQGDQIVGDPLVLEFPPISSSPLADAT